MLVWALVDFAIKLIPIVGDILTAIIKPNTRNCMKVEALLRQRADKRSGSAAAAASGRTVPAPRGATAREPLLVSSQPGAQTRMVTGSGSGAAPSYGTVPAGATASSGPAQPHAEDRRSTRHLLPFWRRNDDSDSDSDGEPAS